MLINTKLLISDNYYKEIRMYIIICIIINYYVFYHISQINCYSVAYKQVATILALTIGRLAPYNYPALYVFCLG